MDDELISAIQKAQAQPAIGEALSRIYAQLQTETECRKPRCDASGACCHFEAYGHRLYITTVELACFATQMARNHRLHQNGPRGKGGDFAYKSKSHLPDIEVGGKGPTPRELPIISSTTGQCRYQVDGLCSVHSIRPFGCRIFFCDPSAETWQQTQYERTHAEIKSLHERFEIPYFYIEWRAALAAIEGMLTRPWLSKQW